jgi:transcription termination/antitermination protein NusA
MSTHGISANRVEMVQQARAVAEELNIDRDIVFRAIEMAYERAGRQQFGSELDIRAKIDRATGGISMHRATTVVEEVENTSAELTLEQAKKTDKEAELGKVYLDALPVTDFSRVGAMAGKQIIMQNIREAQRERQFEDFRDRVGEVVNGIVKRVEYGHTIVDLGRAEAIIRRNESIPREKFGPGDRLRAFIYDVRREQRGPQIFLSRAHPDFMRELFRQEVPEVYDGIIEIPHIARDAGSRAKIAVISNDSSIDPVGTCIGMRGSRVQAVVGELAGEKIDIIPWNPEPATFIVNSLKPAEVAKVLLDEEAKRIEVVVPDDQLSLAIGRRGQNVRLASQLTGWAIDIITEAAESERRQREFAERTALFMENLDVDEVVAQLLVTEGFETIEEVAYVDREELADIEGFDEDTADELQARAREHLDKVAAEFDSKRKEMGVDDGLLQLEGVTLERSVKLGKAGILTIDDFAGLVPDDLRGWFENKAGERVREAGIFEGEELAEDEAQLMIMSARLLAGWISQEDFDAAMAEEEDERDTDDEEGDGEAFDFDAEDSEEAALLAQLAALGATEEFESGEHSEDEDDGNNRDDEE